MDKKWIPFAALILSVLACAMSAATLVGRASSTVRADAGLAPVANSDDLAAQIAELRTEIDHHKGANLVSAEPQAARAPAVASGTESAEVMNRLTSLEQSVALLSRQQKDRSLLLQPKTAERDPKDLQAVATDPHSSEQEKLAALSGLRGAKVDGKDALTHDVLLSMIGIAEQSPDENSRFDVYRNLHGAHDPSVRDSMLRALANDPSAKVRKKVAQDIDTFLADALVVSALRQAADNDADQGVRDQANKTLSGAK